MNLDEKIQYLKTAKDKNKLVIFVGAGVSKNSNLPNWGELVEKFAEKINYPKQEGNMEYNLSSDEYLKIPQYYYNIHGDESYYNVIKEILDVDCELNELHNIIFKLNPKHIITTNYDRLLESAMVKQNKIFDVISKDKEFLYTSTNNYIIKMHGDIKDLNNIVLKENDYLNFQHNHILIESFIKSLLVTNTFLFVGYSLNDYNFKQIMSWVEYLAKTYNIIDEKPKNFIIEEVKDNYKTFLEDYYEKNNVLIIDPRELNTKYEPSTKSNNLKGVGKRVYNTLSYINDYPVDINKKLYLNYKCIKNRRRISLDELFKIYKFKNSEVLYGNILFFSNIEDSDYRIIRNSMNKKEDFLKSILIKAGITQIKIWKNTKCEIYNLLPNIVDSLNSEKYLNSDLMQLQIELNYLEIDKQIKFIEDEVLKAYYLCIINKFENAKFYLENFNSSDDSKHLYNLLLCKFNLGLINQYIHLNGKSDYDEFKDIYNNLINASMYDLNYLNIIFNNNINEQLKLIELKEKHIKIYLKLDNSVRLGDIRKELAQIITITYNYYFYIKENGIFLDCFNNVKVFVKPFIEAILSTYSPKTKRVRNESLIVDFNKYESYKLNKYDLDILIKYSNYNELKEFFKKYEIDELIIDKDIKLIDMFNNLCDYIKVNPIRLNIEYLQKLIFIFSKINFDETNIRKLIKTIENVLINKENQLNIYIFAEVGFGLNMFLNRNKNKIPKKSFEFIINELFTDKVYNQLKGTNETNKIFDFLYFVQNFSKEIYEEKIDYIIDEEKIDYILELCNFNLINEQQKKKITNIILNQLNVLPIKYIITFIIDDLIKYTETIEENLIIQINLYVKEKLNNIGQVFPDPLETILENVVLMFILDKGVNIEKFKDYRQYYDVLDFLINPNEFDYEKIFFEKYNWQKIIDNKKYLNIILENGKNIVARKLKYDIDNNFANEKQIRLYYKYFE